MPTPEDIARVKAKLAMQDAEELAGFTATLPPLSPSASRDLAAKELTQAPDTPTLPRPGRWRKIGEAFRAVVEPLERGTTISRGFLVWGARGSAKGYRVDEFGRFLADAWHGRTRITGRDLVEMGVGQATWDNLQATPAIPPWVKTMLVPWKSFDTSKPPRWSTADALSLVTDLTIDPWAVLSLTPVGMGAKFGRIGSAVSAPNRITARALDTLSKPLGPGSSSVLAALNVFREPVNVFTGKARYVFDRLQGSTHTLKRNLDLEARKVAGATQGIRKYGADDQLLGAYLLDANLAKVANITGVPLRKAGGRTVVALPKRLERKAKQYGLVIEHLMREGIQSGAIDPKSITSVSTLRDFIPHLVGRGYIPRDVLQSWRLKSAWVLPARLKKGRRVRVTAMEQLSSIDMLTDFVYTVRRKIDMEPTLKELVTTYGTLRGTSAATRKAAKLGQTLPVPGGLARWQRKYLLGLANEFTGHARGRFAIDFDVAAMEFAGKLLASPIGKRLVRFQRNHFSQRTVEGLAEFSPTYKISSLLSHNIFRSILGLNLSAAIHNLSQVTNIAMKEGMPAAFKGMLDFANPTFRTARKNVNLLEDFKSLWSETTWQGAFGRKWDAMIFGPFNAAENIIRGQAFNVGLGNYFKTHGLRDLAHAKRRGLYTEALTFARNESLNSAFIYGVMGRSPWLSNPFLRVGTTLTTFPVKQAEFIRRTVASDPSAMTRFLGLHGYLIEQANHHLGLAAEDFLGWGFMPPTRNFGGIPVLQSPPLRLAADTIEALQAHYGEDFEKRDRIWKQISGDLPGVLGWIYAGTGAGLVPAPTVELRDAVVTLRERIATKRQEIGGDFVEITTQDAITNYLVGRTTTQKARQNLNRRIARATRYVQHEMRGRAGKFVKAAMGDSGDDLIATAWALNQPIYIEGQAFYPSEEQLDYYVNDRLARETVSQDVRRLKESQFLDQVFLGAKLELLEQKAR